MLVELGHDGGEDGGGGALGLVRHLISSEKSRFIFVAVMKNVFHFLGIKETYYSSYGCSFDLFLILLLYIV